MRKHIRPFWAETPPFDSLALMSSACLSRVRPLFCSASSSVAFRRPWYLAICWSSNCFSYRKTEILAPGGKPPPALVGDVAGTLPPATCRGYSSHIVKISTKTHLLTLYTPNSRDRMCTKVKKTFSSTWSNALPVTMHMHNRKLNVIKPP